jgi:NAD(P)-dependent dehydrogenase (short-subunit alcohol dehydrogenase family)
VVELRDEVAVVTGGTRGIGAAISEGLGRRGMSVVSVFYRDGPAAAKFQQGMDSLGLRVRVIECDLRQPESVAGLVVSVCSEHGRPRVLVNNAGAIRQPASWGSQDIAAALATLDDNLALTMNMCWAFAPEMAHANWGRIINISSVYGKYPDPAILAYSVAKAGIDAFTEGLARSLAGTGMTVNAISPAVVRTAMTEEAGGDFVAEAEGRTPTRCLATPEDIAALVEALIDVPSLNGTVIPIDGGLRLEGP